MEATECVPLQDSTVGRDCLQRRLRASNVGSKPRHARDVLIIYEVLAAGRVYVDHGSGLKEVRHSHGKQPMQGVQSA